MTSSSNTPESSSNNTTTTTTSTTSSTSSNPPLPSHVHHTPPRPGLLRPGDTPINILPGGTAHTANPDVSSSSKARSQDYSIVDAAKTIKLSDYKTIHTKPCVRDALMTGIVASVGAGGAGVVLGRPVSRAANWAVFSFCASSFAAYQYCLTNRHFEREGMKRAVQVMERRKGDERRKPVGKVVDGRANDRRDDDDGSG